MRCISTFIEQMNHEFRNYSNMEIQRDGYKVDGEGIKKFCQLNQLKSVDYYELHNEKGLLFIEFSDLIAQDESLKARAERIKGSTLTAPDKKTLRINCYNVIHNELTLKYKDSYTIKNLMNKYVSNIPLGFSSVINYIIVVTPLEENIEKSKAIEVMRFLDTLKDKIISSLPRQMYSKVMVVTLDQFLK